MNDDNDTLFLYLKADAKYFGNTSFIPIVRGGKLRTNIRIFKISYLNEFHPKFPCNFEIFLNLTNRRAIIKTARKITSAKIFQNAEISSILNINTKKSFSTTEFAKPQKRVKWFKMEYDEKLEHEKQGFQIEYDEEERIATIHSMKQIYVTKIENTFPRWKLLDEFEKQGRKRKKIKTEKNNNGKSMEMEENKNENLPDHSTVFKSLRDQHLEDRNSIFKLIAKNEDLENRNATLNQELLKLKHEI